MQMAKQARKPSRPAGGPTFNKAPAAAAEEGRETIAGEGSSYMSLPLLPSGLSALFFGPMIFQAMLQALSFLGSPGNLAAALLMQPVVARISHVSLRPAISEYSFMQTSQDLVWECIV